MVFKSKPLHNVLSLIILLSGIYFSILFTDIIGNVLSQSFGTGGKSPSISEVFYNFICGPYGHLSITDGSLFP